MAHEFVGIENHIAFSRGDGGRHDLILEAAGLLRGFRFLLGSRRELVLFLARYTPFPGDILGRDAHVVLVVDVPQAIDDHRVDQLAVHHAQPVARTVKCVRREAHAFLTARDHDAGIAGFDRLCGEMCGLQSRTADFVDGHRRYHVGKAGADGGLARRVLAGGRGQYLAHQHFAHCVWLHAGPGDQRANDFGAEFCRRNFAYCAAELADTGAQCSDNYHIIHLRISSIGNLLG